MRTKTENQQSGPRSAPRRKGAGAKVTALTLRRILVPIDFSRKSRQALEVAIPLVDRGRAFDVIARVAKEKSIDLIVLTTHGRTGLDRFLMGSTAEQVVRHARCPVFVVRTSLGTNKNQQERKD